MKIELDKLFRSRFDLYAKTESNFNWKSGLFSVFQKLTLLSFAFSFFGRAFFALDFLTCQNLHKDLSCSLSSVLFKRFVFVFAPKTDSLENKYTSFFSR